MTSSQRWPYSCPEYFPFLHIGDHLQRVLDSFQRQCLSTKSTAVRSIRGRDRPVSSNREQRIASNQQLKSDLQCAARAAVACHYALFVTRWLRRHSDPKEPNDSNRLRITPDDFNAIMDHFKLQPAFISALSQLHLPSGRGFIRLDGVHVDTIHFWYILPVRVQYSCEGTKKGHISSTAKGNQMDPSHHLHLVHTGFDENGDPLSMDIRGSHIAIACNISADGRKSDTVCFSFMHGRYRSAVEEPRYRLVEAIEQAEAYGREENPFFIHTIHLSSTVRWYTNALCSIDVQLIEYEKSLQRGTESQSTNGGPDLSDINQALHAIAAHLHKYDTEVGSIGAILRDLAEVHDQFIKDLPSSRNMVLMTGAFEFLKSQVEEVHVLLRELEVKIENILALLFNRIQLSNDELMVKNGKQQYAILRATQADAEISREIADKQGKLAEEMKEDSVAMKTIAVTTMFFLPGTSYAALLSMPSVSNSTYIQNSENIWVWIICTVPSTILAFAFYIYWRRRDRERRLSPGKKTDCA